MKEILFAKKYKIDEYGNVFSKGNKKWQSTTKQGYKRISLVCDDGKTRKFLVHRLVALTYLPNPENKPEVNHKDGVKYNNHVDNLEWVTRDENMKHAFSTGLNNNEGENNGRSILSKEDVIDIYMKALDGARVIDLSKEYSVSNSCISDIMKKRNWKEYTENLPNIEERTKKSRISTATAMWVCEQLQKGLQPKEIYEMSTSQSLSLYQIQDIKRRRYLKEISKNYVW